MSATSTTYHEDGTVEVRPLPGRGITLDMATGEFALTESEATN